MTRTTKITCNNGKIRKMGAVHNTPKAKKRAELHARSTHNLGMQLPKGITKRKIAAHQDL